MERWVGHKSGVLENGVPVLLRETGERDGLFSPLEDSGRAAVCKLGREPLGRHQAHRHLVLNSRPLGV